MKKKTNLKLSDGSRIAVLGGGPAGSFFSYFLLEMAARVGRQIQVDIYEPRDYTVPGPAGCNMCAGVVHESLVQYLAVEGINLPPTVVERGIDSFVLHVDAGQARIGTPLHEKRIGALYRGIGPRDLKGTKCGSFDRHLLTLAANKGARVIRERVVEVSRTNGRLQIRTAKGSPEAYDLLAVAVGVNTSLLRAFEELGIGYQPPQTVQCFVREYYLGQEAINQYMGSSIHAFLLNIPGLEFAAFIPKGDYVTLVLISKDSEKNLLQAFVNDPTVRQRVPPDFPLDHATCWCAPRIQVKASPQPFADRIVFLGDCGSSRLNKDGIGSAYRAAKAAATTAIMEGISAQDFKRHYGPFCRSTETDNSIGKMIFAVLRQLKKRGFARRAILNMVADEQQGKARPERGMSLVLWDMFTGSASYRDITLRFLRPVFWVRFLRELVVAIVSPWGQITDRRRRMPSTEIQQLES